MEQPGRSRYTERSCQVSGDGVGGVAVQAQDLDLRTEDEYVRIHGKGGTVRTALLDDRDPTAWALLGMACSQVR